MFSDAEIAAVNLSETVQDHHQLIVGTIGDGDKLKQCSGASQPRPLKLTVISVETKDNVELVECLLETAKHSSVLFKFSHFTDQPSDVAAYLVSKTLLTCTHSSFASHTQSC